MLIEFHGIRICLIDGTSQDLAENFEFSNVDNLNRAFDIFEMSKLVLMSAARV